MVDERLVGRRGWAKVSLGLSILLAVAGFTYFLLAGRPVAGAGLGVVLLIGGIWEYRRRIQDLRAARKYEAEAERNRGRRRG